jgi:transcriptional regulator with XRE-family HTH domain
MNRMPASNVSASPLRAARLARLLTQLEVAKRAGISQTAYSLIERGFRCPRDLPQARRVARAVNSSVAHLWPDTIRRPGGGRDDAGR